MLLHCLELCLTFINITNKIEPIIATLFISMASEVVPKYMLDCTGFGLFMLVGMYWWWCEWHIVWKH